MMKSGILAVTLLAGWITSGVSGYPTANDTVQHRDYVKRWFGISNLPDDKGRTIPWPPWDGRPDYQPIRYCYQQASDAMTLGPILKGAIALWKPAMDVSTLRIVPDTPAVPPLCSDPRVHGDALRIIDVTATHGYSESTIGYWKAPDLGAGMDGRHELQFARLVKKISGPAKYQDIELMAHELGHVIGLAHEHQRPDRDQYVWFVCDNLQDYEEVSQRLPAGVTMEMACSDYDTAVSLGFSALAFLHPPPHAWNCPMSWSQTYDYQSLMHYGSFAAAAAKQSHHTLSDATLLGKYQDGRDRAFGIRLRSEPSAGDIAKVAQLYPLKPDSDKLVDTEHAAWRDPGFQIEHSSHLGLSQPQRGAGVPAQPAPQAGRKASATQYKNREYF